MVSSLSRREKMLSPSELLNLDCVETKIPSYARGHSCSLYPFALISGGFRGIPAILVAVQISIEVDTRRVTMTDRC